MAKSRKERRQLDENDRQTIAQLLKEGANQRTVAARFNVSRTTINRIAKSDRMKRRRNRLSSRQLAKLRRLINAGDHSRAEIARRVGCSERRVYTEIDRLYPVEKDGRTRLLTPRRCPTCKGKVTIWPCVLCHPNV